MALSNGPGWIPLVEGLNHQIATQREFLLHEAVAHAPVQGLWGTCVELSVEGLHSFIFSVFSCWSFSGISPEELLFSLGLRWRNPGRRLKPWQRKETFSAKLFGEVVSITRVEVNYTIQDLSSSGQIWSMNSPTGVFFQNKFFAGQDARRLIFNRGEVRTSFRPCQPFGPCPMLAPSPLMLLAGPVWKRPDWGRSCKSSSGYCIDLSLGWIWGQIRKPRLHHRAAQSSTVKTFTAGLLLLSAAQSKATAGDRVPELCRWCLWTIWSNQRCCSSRNSTWRPSFHCHLIDLCVLVRSS